MARWLPPSALPKGKKDARFIPEHQVVWKMLLVAFSFFFFLALIFLHIRFSLPCPAHDIVVDPRQRLGLAPRVARPARLGRRHHGRVPPGRRAVVLVADAGLLAWRARRRMVVWARPPERRVRRHRPARVAARPRVVRWWAWRHAAEAPQVVELGGRRGRGCVVATSGAIVRTVGQYHAQISGERENATHTRS